MVLQELHQIEAELHEEILPGTEIMTDVGSHHFVKGGSHVLVPQPYALQSMSTLRLLLTICPRSDDPHDPLNWSTKWKTLAIIASTGVSFTQGFGPLALAPMFPYYIKDFDSNLTDVIKFTGVAILVLGFSNFIWYAVSHRTTSLFADMVVAGSLLARLLEGDRPISSHSSSASAHQFGVLKPRHTAPSWVHVS